MKVILPGAAVGLLGGGENSRMLALAACRMGYRVHVFSPANADAGIPLANAYVQASWDDLDRVREFAAGADVVTAADNDVPMAALHAAAASALLRPSVRVFEAIENDPGNGRESTAASLSEFSIIGVRSPGHACAFYSPIAIDRLDGALDIARSPAPLSARITRQAIDLTRDIVEKLDVTGIACVEFILTVEHELVVHEVTPGPHRSGHLTIGACVTDQFEQHLRAVCGLPPGSTAMLSPAAMAVLSESIWRNGEPDWTALLSFPEVKIHFPKVRGGHLTATSPSGARARQIVRAARAAFSRHATV